MENRVSNFQLEELLEYLHQHPALAKGVGLGARSKETIDKQWNDLALKLNSHGSGSSKSGERWKKYWADLKHKTKSRLARRRKDAFGTGGGPSSQVDLSDIDKKVLDIIGEQAVFGDSKHRVPIIKSFARSPSYTHLTAQNVCETTMAADTMEVFVPINMSETAYYNSPSTSGQLHELFTVQTSDTIIATTSGTVTECQKEQVDNSKKTGMESPRCRPSVDRHRNKRNKLGQITTNASKVEPAWIIGLEQRRVDAESKMADAALIMAEAARTQSEITRTLVEVMRQQADDVRSCMQFMQEMHSFKKT